MEFDNMYDAIAEYVKSTDCCIQKGYIDSYNLKKSVPQKLAGDAVTLAKCINRSGFLSAIKDKKKAFKDIYLTSIYNLHFLISVERNDNELKYDYDAKKILNIYLKYYFKISDEDIESLNNEIDNRDYEEKAEKAVELHNKIFKILTVPIIIIPIIIGFKLSVLKAIITFFVLAALVGIFLELIFVKEPVNVIMCILKRYK